MICRNCKSKVYWNDYLEGFKCEKCGVITVIEKKEHIKKKNKFLIFMKILLVLLSFIFILGKLAEILRIVQ
jgi:hypothetical protein